MYVTDIDPSLGTNDWKSGISKANLKEQFISLFENNIAILSLCIVSDICILAQSQLGESDFQDILEVLWKCV